MKRLSILLLVGCTGNSLPPESPAPALVSANCAGLGVGCDSGGECCSGFCQLHGVYAEDYRTCAAPLDDGLYCTAANECASKKCIDYRCGGVGVCEGQRCVDDLHCCYGTYCYNETYADWVCVLNSGEGEWCTADSHCRSGHCKDYVCVP